MHIQPVIKGMRLADDAAADALLKHGILCNWWRRVGTITPEQRRDKLTEHNLDWHLSRFDQIDRTTGLRFSEDTPYISTTAGTYERDLGAGRNLPRPALLTALWFATEGFTQPGYLFHAYLFTLGKKSVPLGEFAEETRELHLYTEFQPYHPEGEIVAKIEIPSVRIEKWEWYDPQRVRRDFARRRVPAGAPLIVPDRVRFNPRFKHAERYTNLRRITV